MNFSFGVGYSISWLLGRVLRQLVRKGVVVFVFLEYLIVVVVYLSSSYVGLRNGYSINNLSYLKVSSFEEKSKSGKYSRGERYIDFQLVCIQIQEQFRLHS